jgi:hypothetical protein
MVILLGGPYEGFMTTIDSFEHFDPGISNPFVVLHFSGLICINAVSRER